MSNDFIKIQKVLFIKFFLESIKTIECDGINTQFLYYARVKITLKNNSYCYQNDVIDINFRTFLSSVQNH